MYTIRDIPIPVVESPEFQGGNIHSGYLDSSIVLDFDGMLLASGLGYVCLLLSKLSSTFACPLRYQSITTSESRPHDALISHELSGLKITIFDHILSPNSLASVGLASSPDSEGEFPLYVPAKNSERRLFEYGLYLLNRNVQQFINLRGYSVSDVRDTLANLLDWFEKEIKVSSWNM
jgi:hypothetical protein